MWCDGDLVALVLVAVCVLFSSYKDDVFDEIYRRKASLYANGCGCGAAGRGGGYEEKFEVVFDAVCCDSLSAITHVATKPRVFEAHAAV